MTRKPDEPLFMRGLDAWIEREQDQGEPPIAEIPEPSQEQQLLDRLWDDVNSLGGTNIDRSFGRYKAGDAAGYNRCIEDVLTILQEIGARPHHNREEDQ